MQLHQQRRGQKRNCPDDEGADQALRSQAGNSGDKVMIEEFEIAKLSLSPGDVLVIKTKFALTQDLGRRIHDHVMKILQPGVRALVLPPDTDLSVLTKADIDTRCQDDIITQRFRARDS